jgi:hypothetical protein
MPAAAAADPARAAQPARTQGTRATYLIPAQFCSAAQASLWGDTAGSPFTRLAGETLRISVSWMPSSIGPTYVGIQSATTGQVTHVPCSDGGCRQTITVPANDNYWIRLANGSGQAILIGGGSFTV